MTNRVYLDYCPIVLFKPDTEWTLFNTGHQDDRHLPEALSKRGLTADDINQVVLSHLDFAYCLNQPILENAAVFISQAEITYAAAFQSDQVMDHSLADSWSLLLANRTVHLILASTSISSTINSKSFLGDNPDPWNYDWLGLIRE